VRNGVVNTGGTGKIAEHGGANAENRGVPLIVDAPGVVAPESVGRWVETAQIAPTILTLFGIDPNELQAVRKEGTPVLPTDHKH
jgi:arylsulfatase A-like enzyme